MSTLLKEIELYSDKTKIYHYSNNGNYPYIRNEFNELINLQSIKLTLFILEVAEYSKINRLDDLLYAQGSLDEFDIYKLGEGSETSVVANNTPFSVLKISRTSPSQMIRRNNIPTSMPCLIRGLVEHGDDISFMYYQPKVKIVEKENLTYYLKKIDIEMMKSGYFLAIGYSDDIVRVYTDGFQVIDDVGYGNVGIGLDHKVHIIDCNVMDVENWEEMNEASIANKIACISYNSKKYGIDLSCYAKQTTDSINSVIKKYEKELDEYLENHGIDFEYEHILS